MPETKWHESIGFKIILSVAAAAVLVNGAFGYLYLNLQERQLGEMVVQSASRISDTIHQSIHADMLENRKENAYRTMNTIGSQVGIEKIRIYSGEGQIVFSTEPGELGHQADKKGDACTACHSIGNPRKELTHTARSRVFRSPDGHRVLGMITPIYNEPACSSGHCHLSPDAQKILGVIDTAMSLEETDAGLSRVRNRLILFSALSIFLISTLVVVLMMRFVGTPVRALLAGTNRIAGGNLDHVIPARGNDEMGHLARSFNRMTEKLKKADEEIHEIVNTLERKFREKTEELQQAQAHLIHAEKLAVLGRIAATVAHEINNPLTGVYTYIKLMERKIAETPPEDPNLPKFREYLATMGREVQRTSAIVLNLLDFSRPKEPTRKLSDVNRLLEESLALLGNRMTLNGVEIRRDLRPVPEIPVDPAQIKQVFINILVNACEAMETGGKIEIASVYDESRREAVVEFVDTGPGIPRDLLPKIFEPFFTTKEKGTGLGLSVAHGIVTRHNGALVVDSTPGAGTLMRVTLPHA